MQSEKSSSKNPAKTFFSTLVAQALEKTQIAKYHTKGGHGFAAEDVNHFTDSLRGKNAEVVGIANDQNGADRLVNGVRIQSKYFQTAADTIAAAFDPASGVYRYADQILEVPLDQYEACISLMQEKIAQGKVPGQSNPTEAAKIIQKGSITYKQARNIARAGNVDSLLFDAQTQGVTSTYVFAVSFVITYAQCCQRGESPSAATRIALNSALTSGCSSLVTGIVSAQILRTEIAAIGVVAVRDGVKVVSKSTIGRELVQRIATGSLGKGVYGAAAINHVSKLLRSNAVTGTVAVAITCTPDFYRALFSRSISWKQFTKNLSVNIAGVIGGVGGWMGGAAAGAAIGSIVPGVGTAVGGIVGGLAGALAGGIGASASAKSVADKIADDDSKAIIIAVETELQNLAHEYMLSESEMTAVLETAQTTITPKWLRRIFRDSKGDSGKEALSAAIRLEFEPSYQDLISQRPRVSPPSVEDVEAEIEDLLKLAESSIIDERGDSVLQQSA